MTNSMKYTELIAGLRRDAQDYAKVAQSIPTSHELSWSARDVRSWEAADALEALTTIPAEEVEREYGKALLGKSDNPALAPSREVAERETDEWNHRIRPRLKKQGGGDPGEGIVVRRVKAGPWEQIK